MIPLLAPTGSVRDFYLSSSYDQLEVDSTVYGWFDLPETEAYYGDGTAGGLAWEAVLDGLIAADTTVDFSLFDDDSNLEIDAITILHSGYGAEWGGVDQYGTPDVDRIWSHKWEILAGWTSNEGILVTDYHISPALWDTMGDDPGRIGVIVHELGALPRPARPLRRRRLERGSGRLGLHGIRGVELRRLPAVPHAAERLVPVGRWAGWTRR